MSLSVIKSNTICISGRILKSLRNKEIPKKPALAEDSAKQYINRIYSKFSLKGTAYEKLKRLISVLKC